LGAALLRHKLWAYPIAIIAFSAFILYQLYRFTLTFGRPFLGSSDPKPITCGRDHRVCGVLCSVALLAALDVWLRPSLGRSRGCRAPQRE
ncbi:MAG: DUF2127 domain-containing protein, partial [Hyphomicrobiaceae bacterium]|nr:DUF2127 domain-containing protein [Hyphomicrobiaceae bacterium]